MAWTVFCSPGRRSSSAAPSRTCAIARNRLALAISSAFLLVYGLANAVQDAWTEQIVKREWTTYELPNVLVPTAQIAWLVIVLCTAAAAFAFEHGPQPGARPVRGA